MNPANAAVIMVNGILNHQPAIFPAENLNGSIGGNGCFPVCTPKIVFTGAGVYRIPLLSGESGMPSLKGIQG